MTTNRNSSCLTGGPRSPGAPTVPGSPPMPLIPGTPGLPDGPGGPETPFRPALVTPPSQAQSPASPGKYSQHSKLSFIWIKTIFSCKSFKSSIDSIRTKPSSYDLLLVSSLLWRCECQASGAQVLSRLMSMQCPSPNYHVQHEPQQFLTSSQRFRLS